MVEAIQELPALIFAVLFLLFTMGVFFSIAALFSNR